MTSWRGGGLGDVVALVSGGGPRLATGIVVSTSGVGESGVGDKGPSSTGDGGSMPMLIDGGDAFAIGLMLCLTHSECNWRDQQKQTGTADCGSSWGSSSACVGG